MKKRMKLAPPPFRNVEFLDRYTGDVACHEVFMSFHNDDDAVHFREWWDAFGAVVFHQFLNTMNDPDRKKE